MKGQLYYRSEITHHLTAHPDTPTLSREGIRLYARDLSKQTNPLTEELSHQGQLLLAKAKKGIPYHKARKGS